MLSNNPETFREDMLKGYVNAYPNYVAQVSGGVVRATQVSDNKIIVINGGGSGHYPAFYGIVGDGFMDATVVGNVFTSPSTDDVLNVVNAVNQGTGIFLIGGNYAGDKINFNIARDLLIKNGVDCRTFYITADIASADFKDRKDRRGNVGTFMIFKAAGAASAAGVSFDDLVRITTKANNNTHTISVGFHGCTLPGENEPLFHVPQGKMEIGQGIHGEAGVKEVEIKPADDIAHLLVDYILAEAPSDNSKHIAVILDGLGSTKYEELFVVWGTVRSLLEEKGYILVEPLVGEYVTSLDMEGIALSVEFLDLELEKYWLAPCDTPSFRRGMVSKVNVSKHKSYTKSYTEVAKQVRSFENGSIASNLAADYIVLAFKQIKNKISSEENNLAKIDAIAGDGDHGRGMVKGSTYAMEAAEVTRKGGAAAGTVLKEAGRAWAAKAGGTSGVLWGAALEAAGDVVGDHAESYDTDIAARAVKAAYKKIMELGGARQGDKTMLDVLIPFGEALESAAQKNIPLREAWASATIIAQQASKDTASMLPKVGRARPAAKRSLGTPDAGAVSMALCIQAALVNIDLNK